MANMQSNGSSPNLLEDPDYKLFMDRFSKHLKQISSLSLLEQRKLNKEFSLKNNICHENIHHIENIEITGFDNNKIPIRIYIPNTSKNLPLIVYFHGGGWVFGSVDQADATCRRLANYSNCIVASVEYRLAPEFPFPKPLEDCYAATQWMADNSHLFGANEDKIIVGGESAGGNLAAGVSLMARDKQGPKIAAQLLINPVTSSYISDEVYDRCPDQQFLTKDVMRYFWSMYIQKADDLQNPYASPLHSRDFSVFPATLLILAEYDPLNDESEKFVARLQKANVRVIKKTVPGVIHGFITTSLYGEKQKIKWSKEIGSDLHKLGF